MTKQIILLAAVVLLSIFALTVIWEFWLENKANQILDIEDSNLIKTIGNIY